MVRVDEMMFEEGKRNVNKTTSFRVLEVLEETTSSVLYGNPTQHLTFNLMGRECAFFHVERTQ